MAALAILLIGGGGGLYASGVLDSVLASVPGEDPATEEPPAPVEPEPEPLAPACIRLSVVADDKGPNGNWDFPAPRPDISVTSDTHGNVRFSCDNDYRCSSGNFQNGGRQDRITLLIQDLDIDQHDLMGAGNCDIPSSRCRLGHVTVTVSGC